jgi:PadR family transcriptional regulator PadR
MPTEPRITVPILHILGAMLDDPQAECYGLELSRLAGFKSGTIYPALGRLEHAGWLASRWEQREPAQAGRPQRRLYRLTAEGEVAARQALGRHLEHLAPEQLYRPRAQTA